MSLNFATMGVAAVLQQQQQEQRMKEIGSAAIKQNMEAMATEMKQFKVQLEDFSIRHREDINSNPIFRRDFHKLCQSAGIDPLATPPPSAATGGKKSMWAKLGMGQFYNELAVRIIDVCVSLRNVNGGYMEVGELCAILNRHAKDDDSDVSGPSSATSPVTSSAEAESSSKKSSQKKKGSKKKGRGSKKEFTGVVSPEDIHIAIDRMSGLMGTNAKIVTCGTKEFIKMGGKGSDMGPDAEVIMRLVGEAGTAAASDKPDLARGRISLSQVVKYTSLSQDRAERAMKELTDGGVAMVDSQVPSGGETLYWFLSVIPDIMG